MCGVSGAGNYNDERDAHNLDGIPDIYVLIEPDRGGEGIVRWLERSRIRDRVRLVHMAADAKDPRVLPPSSVATPPLPVAHPRQ
jgi:hypothetical protein